MESNQLMTMPQSLKAFVFFSFVAAALSMAYADTARAAATAPDSRVLATIGKTKITEAEVDEKARPQLASVENQVYMIKKRTLDDMIDDYLIDQAAKKAGLSKDAYLKREVEDKAPAPTEAEMKDFYNKNQYRIRQPYDKIKAPLEQYMLRQKVNAQRAELIAKLRRTANVKVDFAAPRIQVSTKASAGSVGPSNAPVTIVEFSDYQCPYCERAESSVQEVLKKYGDKVHFVYMDFPLPMHSNAMKAAQAARCAGDQGKYWPYHDALFADQTKLDDTGLKATAERLKLDPKKFDQCLAGDLHLDQIKKSQEAGSDAGVDGTPTFIINGQMLNGAQSASEMESIIDDQLAQANVKEATAH
jgi:protein-disulfide isomerase